MRHPQIPQPSLKRNRAGALMAVLQHLTKSGWNGQDMQASISNCKTRMMTCFERTPAPAGFVAIHPSGLVRGYVMYTLLSTPRNGTRHDILAAHRQRVPVDQSLPKPQSTLHRSLSCPNPSSGHVTHTPLRT